MFIFSWGRCHVLDTVRELRSGLEKHEAMDKQDLATAFFLCSYLLRKKLDLLCGQTRRLFPFLSLSHLFFQPFHFRRRRTIALHEGAVLLTDQCSSVCNCAWKLWKCILENSNVLRRPPNCKTRPCLRDIANNSAKPAKPFLSAAAATLGTIQREHQHQKLGRNLLNALK